MKKTCGTCRYFRQHEDWALPSITDGRCNVDGVFVDRCDVFDGCWEPATVEQMRKLIGGAE